ncbi:hypothetical protein BD311DRAFT_749657 [Dichomitus squalens]|uniref:Uncharacterized protein n=1 Tax=Dichomitus squalens TaxID=114155 RepID=A0A4Q9N200_9APHY|nr:hypothetical protein BD311DRAFT_749657 [Dichomitus squalens]
MPQHSPLALFISMAVTPQCHREDGMWVRGFAFPGLTGQPERDPATTRYSAVPILRCICIFLGHRRQGR